MITLTGNPKSTQNCYRFSSRGGYMTKSCKELKEDYMWQAQSQWKDEVLADEIEIDVRIYFGDKRVRDVDNFNKLWMDALTGIVYEDDKQIKRLSIEKHYDKKNPRLEITIIE